MSERKHEPHPLAGYFHEEGSALLGLKDTGDNHQQETFGSEAISLPVIPDEKAGEEKTYKSFWRMLRLFFRSGKGGGGIDDLFPASLSPYRNRPWLRSDYPVWIGIFEDQVRCAGLSDLLRDATREIAPNEEDARILKDNLIRLEGILRKKVTFAQDTYEAKSVFHEGIQDLIAELNISGSEGESFRADAAALRAKLPQSGDLIPYFQDAGYHILTSCLSKYRPPELTSFQSRLEKAVARLRDLLAIEKEKTPEAISSDHLHDTLQFADTFVNFDELSAVLPDGSANAMPPDRIKRIQKLLSTLEEESPKLEKDRYVIIAQDSLQLEQFGPEKNLWPGRQFISEKAGQLCRSAMEKATRQLEHTARLFAALRIAELELANNYRPELHADLFDHFSWELFSEEELMVSPTTFLLLDGDTLDKEEFSGFSHLLSSGLPVRILAVRKGRQHQSTDVTQPEISAISVAHRNVYVAQTSTADPLYFMKGLVAGLRSPYPAFFHLFAPQGKETDRNQLFLQTSAAVESRDFPSFIYDRAIGPKWGSRFDIQNNPEKEADWPRHQLEVKRGEEKELLPMVFTLADFAALEEQNHTFFNPVPPEYWSDQLVPVDEYLDSESTVRINLIPYIWMADSVNMLHKVAIAWPLVQRAYERLDFWHFLQENAGVHSYHVEKALDQAQKAMEAEYADRAAELERSYQQELKRIREETAQETMEQLAATLLDLDLDAPVSTRIPVTEKQATVAPAEPAETTSETENVNTPEEKPVITLAEAYIDTPLCTSCNECLEYNKNIFRYNGDKQAFVADPKGGPFADIVEAAENCPVGIIHPGAPQDPGEPGLEELIKRAEPYNG